jgi:hypothetical protein
LLEGAVDAFLDSVTERGFDEPLLALLRAEWFERVRLTHGSAEFGKDVIAQKGGEQWAWQSKAGNVGQGDFRQMTGQLDELRLSNYAHPDFDGDLPRRPVLVTTGRLTGNAPLSLSEYNERARARAEPELEHWGRDILVGKLAGNPDAVLRGSVDGQLLSLLGGLEEGRVDMDAVEVFSRRWTSWDPARLAGLAITECALLCERLRMRERLDLACHLGLCAVCGTCAATVAADDGEEAIEAAGAVFEYYARLLWEHCDAEMLHEDHWIGPPGPGAWVTYPVRCVRLAELVSLLALRVHDREPEMTSAIAEWLTSFLEAQPGTAMPFSDRYAVSLVPCALVLRRSPKPGAVERLLTRATVWLCDRYELGNLGLASHEAAPREEIELALGAPFESVDRKRRRTSHLAAVLIDLCAVLRLQQLYADVHNDVRAVNAVPAVLVPGEGAERYQRTGLHHRWDFNPDYADELTETEPAAPHLPSIDAAVAPTDAWRLLAISSALRDRHFPDAIATFAYMCR